jgi:hypothetical protein
VARRWRGQDERQRRDGQLRQRSVADLLRVLVASRRTWPVACAVLVVLVAACSRDGGRAATQDNALADGTVTTAEYRSAIDATTACVEEAGYSAAAHLRSDGLIFSIGVGLGPGQAGDSDAGDAAQAALDRCFTQYAYDVERHYFLEHVPTGAERDAMFDDLLSCLTGAGVTGLTRASTEEEIVGAIWTQYPDAPEAGMDCLDQYRFVFPEGWYP